jgi:hypothetical protein
MTPPPNQLTSAISTESAVPHVRPNSLAPNEKKPFDLLAEGLISEKSRDDRI